MHRDGTYDVQDFRKMSIEERFKEMDRCAGPGYYQICVEDCSGDFSEI